MASCGRRFPQGELFQVNLLYNRKKTIGSSNKIRFTKHFLVCHEIVFLGSKNKKNPENRDALFFCK
jgi:hypothetical protein